MLMEQDNPLSALSAAQRLRLAFIEFRVWFYGEVARKHVLERFEIATAAGTRDLMLYKQLAPNNVSYDQKHYRYLPTFSPLFQHDADKVLAALTAGVSAADTGRSSETISHAAPKRLNQPTLDTLATVTRAIHAGQVLSLTFLSMKKGPGKRIIVPHSLVDSGLRWHVRAFDRKRAEFRDFVVTRIEAPTLVDEEPKANERPDNDIQWTRIVELDLVPHPRLARPEIIKMDYGMTDGSIRMRVRAAVAGYMLLRWSVDASPNHSLTEEQYRLWLSDPLALYGVENAKLAPGYRAPATSTTRK